QDLLNVAAGIYSVSIADGICVNVLENIEVGSPAPLALNAAFVSTVSCWEGTDGAIELNMSGGTPPYQVLWNNGAAGEQLSDLPAGDYFASVSDANGCMFETSTFQVTQNSAIQMNGINSQDVSCFGAQDGSIQLQPEGGTAPYFYHWSHGQQGAQATNLAAGAYQVTIEDANACSLVLEGLNLNQPPALIFENILLENASCNGAADAQITVNVEGGTAPYTFLWNNGMTSATISSLAPGPYQVTVTDAQACILISDPFMVSAPEVLTLSSIQIQQVSCNGVDDGGIDIEITGGAEPYTYQWSNGSQEKDLIGVGAGTYAVTIVDANNCSLTTIPFELDIVFAQSASIELIQPPTCFTENNGVIFTEPPSSEWSFYQWNTGQTSEDIQSLAAGAYVATISNANGCFIVTDSIVLEAPSELTIDVLSIEAINCFDAADGSIDVAVSGGSPPYVYSWSNGGQDEDITGLSSGLYQLIVLDANACISVSPFINIGMPEPMMIEVDEIVNVGCSEASMGSIAVSVFGGSLPIQFNWSNGATSEDIQGLVPGKYALTITDNNECTQVLPAVEVQQLAQDLDLIPVEVQELSCAQANDGSLAMTILGGTPPFQYNWSNGNLDSLNTNLASGIYQLTVTDANGCLGVSEAISISSPEPLIYQVIDVQASYCEGQNNGGIDLDVSGGTAPYQYQWSNGATTQDLNHLASGTYWLTVQDANQCQLIIQQGITVMEDQALQLLPFSNPSLGANPNGSATTQVINGQWPFTFQWDENTGNQNDSIAIELFPGTYQVTVTDAQLCSQSIEIVVDQTTSNAQIGQSDFTIFPNPATDIVYLELLNPDLEAAQMRIYTLDGQSKELSFDYAADQQIYRLFLTDFPAGMYYLEVWCKNGNRLLHPILIHSP
ncbi:MAG: T9SS type A sorting domain-containing protein, partial [Bacteroidota bacterium]